MKKQKEFIRVPSYRQIMETEKDDEIKALRLKLDKAREQISNTRDLLRTGVAPDLWNYTMEGWTLHKCNKAAGELTRLLEELE